MIIKNSPEQAKKVDAPVDGRIMHSDSRVETILLTLAPGESMPEHTNPFDVIFICISGNAKLVSGNRNWEITTGETIFVSKEELRGWKNTEAASCRIIVVKVFAS